LGVAHIKAEIRQRRRFTGTINGLPLPGCDKRDFNDEVPLAAGAYKQQGKDEEYSDSQDQLDVFLTSVALSSDADVARVSSSLGDNP
jgi:hypothetical protein